MPQKINLSAPPYNDDYKSNKGFYRVLFRPGYSIQTRELTTLQSILQNQIENIGRSSFKQGQQVIPGEVSFNNKLDYVKLASVSEVAVNQNGNIVFKKYDIANLIGSTLKGITSGVTATVISFAYGSDVESDIIFVTYTNSGNGSNESTFRQGETLEALDILDTPTLVVGTNGSVLPSTIDVQDYDTGEVTTIESPAMGYASAVKVEEGVYFVNGFFVNNTEQLIVVDKYYNKPSAKVGFLIKEDVITPEKDSTLYDNSKGFSNYSAPGAHRLKIDLELTVKQYDEPVDEDYVQLVSIKNGEVQQLVKSTDYNLIEETLARRTFDESGDYVVDNFSLDLREYYQKDGNKGIYPLNQETNRVNKLSVSEASSLMVASVGPGKAYIKGYEIVNKQPKDRIVSKSRDILTKDDVRIKSSSLSYFNVTNVYGSIPLNAEGQELTAYATIQLNSTFTDGTIGYANTEASSGSGAVATASISNGAVTSIQITNGGSGYTSAPAVTFSSPTQAGTTARGIANISAGQVTGITITNAGSGYTVAPSISFTDTVKQTVQRRSKKFTQDDAIITVYVANPGNYAPNRSMPTPSTFGTNSFNKLWYISSKGTSFATTTAKSVDLLSYSIVKRPFDISTNSAETDYLELTVSGDKEDLINLFKEYDDTDSVAKRRKLFVSEDDAKRFYFTAGNTIFPYSEILDYNEVITPIVGLCKPKDFSLIEKGGGFNTDTSFVLSKGRLSDGSSAYNSIFRLSYFNPVFFTRIILDTPIPSTTFLPGKYILGSTSGAYGVIEGSTSSKYSTSNVLFVKTLSGQFLPGETITDESGNSKRIAREGTISHFVVANRGAGYPVSTTIKINGISYENSAIEISYSTGAIYKVVVKDRNLVSQVYSSTPSISFNTGVSNPSVSAIVIPVLFRNTVYTYSQQDVKSMQSTFGAGNAYTFTADVESFNSKYISNKVVTDFTFSGDKGAKYIECNGFSGNPSSDLSQGDIVQFTDVSNNPVRAVVQRVDKAEGLTKARVYLDNILRENVSNTNVVRIRPNIENSAVSTLIIPTGSKYLKSVVSSPDDSKIKYYFRRDFVTTVSTSGGNITFAAQLPYGTQRFASFSEENFILTILDKKSATTYNGITNGEAVESGDIIYLKREQVNITNSTSSDSGLTAGSVSVTLPSSFFGTSTNFPVIKLTATLEVSKARPRLKTAFRNKRILVVSPGDRVVPIRGIDYDSNSTDTLSYSDVYKVRYVYEGTTQTPPVVSDTGELVTGTDVTERFSFDDGQRDTFYDVSRLTLKPGFDPPSGQLIIAFDYFEHSQGDFCTVDSYLHESGVALDEIPNFNSVVLGKISLRDVIDFRPKVDSSAIISGYQDTSLLSTTDYNSFTGSGGITSSTPAVENTLDYTISFSSQQYLDRIDGVFLNKNGEFFIKEGNASLNPTKPADVDDSIALYYLFIPAYTSSANDVRVIPVDNKRYTMRDIGKLEKRIERLEKYTMLSILEQQALNMQVKDEIGMDRFKTGFVVDGFENHAIGNVLSVDHKCAIDTQQSLLRPKSVESSFDLVEINTREDQRFTDGYKRTKNILTLDYQSVPAIQNNFATKPLNINPFVVLQYAGDARLLPNIDTWFDATEKPLILDNDSKLFSVFYAKEDARDGFASIYNNYIVNWIGTNRVFYNVSSLSSIDSVTASATTKLATTSSSSNISPQNNQLAQGVSSQSVGSNSVISSAQFFCRSKAVYFNLTRMKPKTKLYVFMDGKSIDRWAIQDYAYTGIPGNSLSVFGSGIITDNNGNASGMILIPSGYAPQEGSTWNNDLNSVQYDTENSTPLSFITGVKTIKFSSNSEGVIDSTVDTFAEVNYYASGSIPQQPASIISTTPAIFKSQEGIQFIDNTRSQVTPNPLSQSFRIEKYPGGLFLTGLDLYFGKKSATIPVKVYLTNIESGKPGKYIIPGSECVLNPDTYLKIYTNGTVTLKKGEFVTGVESRCSGPIKEVYDRNNILVPPSINDEYTLSNLQVYTLVLDNHNGKAFKEGEDLSIPSVSSFNASQNTNLRVTIAKDSGRITALKINNAGSGYETATLRVESPQLIGGISAVATCTVSGGNIYDASISVQGSGYTEAPSVIIEGSGISASNASIQAILTIDTPAVRMGVAVDPSSSTVTPSTTPTRFNFEYPVFLQNNTDYAFVVESDSTDYVIWASKLGEVEISSQSVVTSQPLLGSVFKSQNVDNWTEDLFEDIKFTLYRAEFDISRPGYVYLTNEQLGYEKLDENPFETDSLSDTTATSLLFKNNNKVIKIKHRSNGFDDSGRSYVAFKNSDDIGGVTSEYLNSTLFEVNNCGSDFYNIISTTRASSNAVGGGKNVLALYNKKYEKLYAQVSFLNFNETNVDASVKTTNIVPIDSKVSNYVSYSQTADFEKTFLNEEHFFNNQKVIASRINELKNSSSIPDQSLTYKLTLSSKTSYLSPVIDLSSSSVKVISNQVEKSTGVENRFGRRDQVITFYPVYKFAASGSNVNSILAGDASNPKVVTGLTSKARGAIVKNDTVTNEIYVKMLTDVLFVTNETLEFASQPSLTGVSVSNTGLQEVAFDFAYNSTVVCVDKTDITKTYDNVINGKVVFWDAQKKILRVSNNKNPINSNYTSPSTTGSAYARIPKASSSVQQPDIFRVGDLLSYENQDVNTRTFLEIKSIAYSDGILYVPEKDKNSSSIAKYVTKEISLESSSTSLDVRLTANIFEEDDIKVLYKIKPISSQFNFDDIGWEYFNGDGRPDVRVIPSSDNSIAGYMEDQSSYKEYKFSAPNLNEFSSFAVKIVLTSSNPVYVPKIQDVKIVASF